MLHDVAWVYGIAFIHAEEGHGQGIASAAKLVVRSVQKKPSVRVHVLYKLHLGLENAVTVSKVFKVHLPYVCIDGIVGRSDCAEPVHFSEIAYAKLQHSQLMLRTQPEKDLRESVFVVKIAAGAEDIVLLSQNAAEHLPRARLANATHDGDYGDAALTPEVCGKPLHGGKTAVNANMTVRNVTLAYCAMRTPCNGSGDIVVAVHAFALECDKKRCGSDHAAVHTDLRNVFVLNMLRAHTPGPHQDSAARSCRFGKGDLQHSASSVH